MFLGGAGLADIMLYCRNRIYPLGLPNGVSHVLTAFAVVLRQVFGLQGQVPSARPAHAAAFRSAREGAITGRFALLAVTTLEKLLLSGELGGAGPAARSSSSRSSSAPARCSAPFSPAWAAGLAGRKLAGVHVEEADEISIEGDSSQVILDGETFSAEIGHADPPAPRHAVVVRPPRRLSDDAVAKLTRPGRRRAGQPVDPRVAAMAAAIAAKHGEASRAVLFYGTCLREKQLDGLMLDFYLIVSDYRAAYGSAGMAAANRLIPPNVFPFAA